jgi:hypothetical protein
MESDALDPKLLAQIGSLDETNLRLKRANLYPPLRPRLRSHSNLAGVAKMPKAVRLDAVAVSIYAPCQSALGSRWCGPLDPSWSLNGWGASSPPKHKKGAERPRALSRFCPRCRWPCNNGRCAQKKPLASKWAIRTGRRKVGSSAACGGRVSPERAEECPAPNP